MTDEQKTELERLVNAGFVSSQDAEDAAKMAKFPGVVDAVIHTGLEAEKLAARVAAVDTPSEVSDEFAKLSARVSAIEKFLGNPGEGR